MSARPVPKPSTSHPRRCRLSCARLGMLEASSMTAAAPSEGTECTRILASGMSAQHDRKGVSSELQETLRQMKRCVDIVPSWLGFARVIPAGPWGQPRQGLTPARHAPLAYRHRPLRGGYMSCKCVMFVAAVAVAGLALAACSGNGPNDPMPPEMPMQVTAADSLSH